MSTDIKKDVLTELSRLCRNLQVTYTDLDLIGEENLEQQAKFMRCYMPWFTIKEISTALRQLAKTKDPTSGSQLPDKHTST